MLVLSRKKNEWVVLKQGGQIICQICLVEIRNDNKVRLGFRADPDIEIDRAEVHNAKLKSKYPASKSGQDDKGGGMPLAGRGGLPTNAP